MPTYLWRCPKCKVSRDVIAPVAARNIQEYCTCRGTSAQKLVAMVREITAPLVQPDIKPYQAVTGDRAGQMIGSRRQHREFLKRNRLVEVGDAPIRDTRQMRKTTSRKEIREELRRVVPEVLRKQRKA